MAVTTVQKERIQKLFNNVLDKLNGVIPYNTDMCKEVMFYKSIRSYGRCRNKRIIMLNEYMLECTDEDITKVLVHEVVHTCKDTKGHDYMFHVYGNRVYNATGIVVKTKDSIQSATKMHELGKQRKENNTHIYKCVECGAKFRRYRRINTNRYVCACGGHLIVV